MVASSNPEEESFCIPVVDLSSPNGNVAEMMVKACERFGFFMATNHGVSAEAVKRMESEALNFFALPPCAKKKAGPPDPLGYGCGKIGSNGDVGVIEYLLLPTNPHCVVQRSMAICRKNPLEFSCVVKEYVNGLRGLACTTLDLLAQGLRLEDGNALTGFLEDEENDSVFRLNLYPACEDSAEPRLGFGEHTDPQILTLLTSNSVSGLQILMKDGRSWIPVHPDPNSFCIMVGDCLQVLTNGRLVSARHRVLISGPKSRLSMVYFGAPSLQSWISPLVQLVPQHHPCKYTAFTWSEYKKTCYSLKLGQSRLTKYEINPPQ